jgi:hypothetical protein
VARLFASLGAGDLHFWLISAQHTAWLGTTKFLRRRRLGFQFGLRGLDCALKDDSKLIGLQGPWQEIVGSKLNGFCIKMDVIERRDKDYSGIRPQLLHVGKQVKTGFGRRQIDENRTSKKQPKSSSVAKPFEISTRSPRGRPQRAFPYSVAAIFHSSSFARRREILSPRDN